MALFAIGERNSDISDRGLPVSSLTANDRGVRQFLEARNGMQPIPSQAGIWG